MSETVISVENLGKRYRLGAGGSGDRYTTLRDVLSDKAKSFFRRRNGASDISVSASQDFSISRTSKEDFWALRDVSFEVRRGEVVGIIGRNGAGKSTLLKILSRITEPTEGRVRIKGRVASLLEVGTGFHPELTGRENIYLNGAVLGMNRLEIRAKFDEIVTFAEVEKFLDTPVKRYSSGMYVRLAFAVAAHLEPEILIVDEVLAVGDAEFQKKCLGKMGEVARGGRTVLFVSHNMAAIKTLCCRVIVLKGGLIEFDGNVEAGIDQYLSAGKAEAFRGIIPDDLPRQYGTGEAKIRAVELKRENSQSAFAIMTGHPLQVVLQFEVLSPLKDVLLEIGIVTLDGLQITQSLSSDDGASVYTGLRPGKYEVQLSIENVLFPGGYSILAGIHKVNGTTVDWIERALDFEVLNTGKEDPNHYKFTVRGYFRPTQSWRALRLFSNGEFLPLVNQPAAALEAI